MRLLILLLGLSLSFSSFADCFTELDAELYGCIPITNSKDGDYFCRQKYGASYRPYYTTDTCSKELAAQLRGEEYRPSAKDNGPAIKAACMSYEQGTKMGCNLYDYVKAEQYCAENFGNRYVPFIISGKCTEEAAAKSRGEVDSKLLVADLNSMLTEAEKVMTMLDREGMTNPLGGFISKRPAINNEFYTNVVKQLMASMNMIKERLYKNSHLNVKINNPHSPEFIKFAFRYLALHGRLHKLYAYVAHKNQWVLNTYTYQNLAYLNLKLKKDFALEILARVNYLAKTENNGKDIVFEIGEQEKQTYEYQAISMPESNTEYAKLISFLGIRENVTNLWAVQRLSESKIHNDAVNSCGQGFLSFRPGAAATDNLSSWGIINPFEKPVKSGDKFMQTSEAMQELEAYDVFYNDYMKRWEQLEELSVQEKILNNNQKAADMIFEVLWNVPEVKKFLSSQPDIKLKSQDDFRAFAFNDAELMQLAEDHAWKSFAKDHFSTIVMPGDGIKNKDNIIFRIATDAYEMRVAAIVETLVGAYVWLSDDAIKSVENKVKDVIAKKYRDDFYARMKNKLSFGLHNYNNLSLQAKANQKQKIEETITEAYLAVKAAFAKEKLTEKKELGTKERLEPIDIEELLAFFHSKIDREYYDVRKTLESNPEMAKILKEFFDLIGVYFDNGYQQYTHQLRNMEKKVAVKKIMLDWRDTLSMGLREATIKAAIDIYKKYPFHLSTMYAIGANNFVENDANESKKSGLLSDEELIEIFEFENRTHVPSWATYGGITGGKPGHNPDGMTSGKISRPLELKGEGKIVTPKGVESVSNNEMFWLTMDSGFISKEAIDKLRIQKSGLTGNKQSSQIKPLEDPRHFIFRVFHALNLEFVAIPNPIENYFGSFARTLSDQEILIEKRLAQAYQMAPLLRNEYTWTRTKNTSTWYGGNKTEKVTETSPLLVRLAVEAYNPKTGEILENKAMPMVLEVIKAGIKNTPSKLSKFCRANYLNYKNDPDFKDVFKASRFARETLKSPLGVSDLRARMHKNFDDSIHKEIRGKWEGWNEDYFEPVVLVTGTAALLALGIVLIIGTGGTATPGVIGGLYAFATTFLAIEFFVSSPFVAASLYARFNTHFIEVPQSLKFQRSLATSQLDQAKIVDWDKLKEDENQNWTNKAWTAGLAPLDFLYGAALVRHVRGKLGINAVKAYQKLTGVKLRGWSAPPANLLSHQTFAELRRKNGMWKAVYQKAKQGAVKVAAYTPRYQPISESLIKSAPLRAGISKAAKDLKIHNTPWVLSGEISEYLAKLKSKLSVYKGYVAAEGELVDRIRLNKSFGLKDIKAHGLKYSSVTFIPKSLYAAMKQAVNGKPQILIDYFKNFGQVWNELKTIQGELVQSRIMRMESVMDKLNDFHKSVRTGAHQSQSGNLMDDFLKTVADEEIMILQEVTKHGSGNIKKFNWVYKQHAHVMEDLRPMEYLYGSAGIKFGRIIYPQNIIMGEKVVGYKVFENEAHDLARFYENMMAQNGDKANNLLEFRKRVEETIWSQKNLSNAGNN